MFKIVLASAAFAAMAITASAETYSITVTNNLDEELLAPILVTDASNDVEIFSAGYVTPEA